MGTPRTYHHFFHRAGMQHRLRVQAVQVFLAVVTMTFPVLGEFEGIPSEYQKASFVPNSAYQGGGYYAGTGLGQHYSYAQLERLWLDAGGTMQEAPEMAYIAENVESGGDSGDWNSSGATGLWQIEWPSNYSGPREDLFTPLTNARVAVKMFQTSGFSPWGNDPRQNLGIPPAQSVPNEKQAVPGGSSATGNTGSTGTSSSGIGSGIAGGILGSISSDTWQRLGLIILGGALILVGIWMLAGRQAISVVFPEIQRSKP